MLNTSDKDSDEGELSHTGLTEDSEASDGEGGGATPVTKAGKKKGSSHVGKSSGGKSSGSKTSSGKSGDGKAGGGSKAESWDDGGGKKAAPSPSRSGSSTPEDKPPTDKVESKSSNTGGSQVLAAAEP
ncbi:hypothetical protein PF010_g29502 [Phytophthora fragariae]|uniref:Uncharacterized protein n=1 Tax=Phytophthora fragariae TaxID=53985 RepID=A0A6A3GN03_9STRA|nr:hypothetical protein PF011_g30599 [Phytophthora fragariae]KAE9062200.1 hypothetical protein PF010_g29502 [Phytophthora fragariae]KAE9166994.1 hypothetical protein PF004_g28972 [Phytophthora fragariae]